MTVASVERRWMLRALGLAGAHGLVGCSGLKAGLKPMQPFVGATETGVLRVTHDSFSVAHPRQHATLRLSNGKQVARFEMAGDFGERVVIAEKEDTVIVVQEFDVRVQTETIGKRDPGVARVRAHGKVSYVRLDRNEMERPEPEGRGILEEPAGIRVPIHFKADIITLRYPDAEMQVWMEPLNRAYQIVSDGVSVLHAAVNYSYFGFGKREFNLIRAVSLPELLERRAMQALLMAKLVIGD